MHSFNTSVYSQIDAVGRWLYNSDQHYLEVLRNPAYGRVLVFSQMWRRVLTIRVLQTNLFGVSRSWKVHRNLVIKDGYGKLSGQSRHLLHVIIQCNTNLQTQWQCIFAIQLLWMANHLSLQLTIVATFLDRWHESRDCQRHSSSRQSIYGINQRKICCFMMTLIWWDCFVLKGYSIRNCAVDLANGILRRNFGVGWKT